ncbi:hypothetical protein [Priestia megaterium]|uniref:hypothetical protein n=1 Tax=Priestia megaterium TaxID=1404 RepID=UPI00159BA8F2|nr:hypothetical protein [Priestia megaterium]
MSEIIIERVEHFKRLLIDNTYTMQDIIEEFLVFGTPYIYIGQEGVYYNLKKQVADFFNVNQRNIFITGSSKLGFSIAPSKLWRPIDGDPEKDSDIDIVIISDKVFDYYWKSILDYNEKTIMPSKNNQKHAEFLDYFFKGWLRPDKFPYRYEGADEWFEFFRKISYKKEFGGRKVAAAIYREEYFFNKYNTQNLNGIRTILRGEGD